MELAAVFVVAEKDEGADKAKCKLKRVQRRSLPQQGHNVAHGVFQLRAQHGREHDAGGKNVQHQLVQRFSTVLIEPAELGAQQPDRKEGKQHAHTGQQPDDTHSLFSLLS